MNINDRKKMAPTPQQDWAKLADADAAYQTAKAASQAAEEVVDERDIRLGRLQKAAFDARNPDPTPLLRAMEVPAATYVNGLSGLVHYVASGFQGVGNTLCTGAALAQLPNLTGLAIGIPGIVLASLPYFHFEFFSLGRPGITDSLRTATLKRLADQAWAELLDAPHAPTGRIGNALQEQDAPRDPNQALLLQSCGERGLGLLEVEKIIEGRITQIESSIKAIAGLSFGAVLTLAADVTLSSRITVGATCLVAAANVLATCVGAWRYRCQLSRIVREKDVEITPPTPSLRQAQQVVQKSSEERWADGASRSQASVDLLLSSSNSNLYDNASLALNRLLSNGGAPYFLRRHHWVSSQFD